MDSFEKRQKEFYNVEAPIYDQKRFTNYKGEFYRELEEKLVCKLINPNSSLKILDVATGTGRISVPLAKEGALVTGLDLSENMLNFAKERASEFQRNISFVIGSGRDLPFKHGTFDVVTSFKFLHLIPNSQKRTYLEEMLRVLKPGGVLLVQFNSPFHGVFLRFLKHILRKRKGSIRTQCLWPDQVRWLFKGADVESKVGVNFPFSALLAAKTNKRLGFYVNKVLCERFPFNYLCFMIIVVARKF